MGRRTHGMTNTRFYGIYRGIVNRCNLPTDNNYLHYGARGIKCNWESFEDFYRDMRDGYKSHVDRFGNDTSIDRIDVNGNYCKENCRRATQKEQGNNTRMNVKLKFNGKEYPSIQTLCEYLGLKYNALYKRIFLEGQDIDIAIYEMTAKKQKYQYKGVMYKGITDMCRKLGLNRTSIAYRLKIGMTIDEAIEKDFRPYPNK